jgi:hypothetical protein
MQDINENKVSDFQDALKNIKQSEEYQQQMNLKREQEGNKKEMNFQKIALEREKLQTQKEVADKQLEIARENKNRFDSKSSGKKAE